MTARPTNRHVALFLPDLRGGGAERAMATLASSLVKEGCRVDLVLSEAAGPYLKELRGVSVIDLRQPFLGFAVAGLARYLRRSRPQVLLATMKETNLVAIWARMLSRSSCRLVVREANTISQEFANERSAKGRLKERLVRRFYPHADAVIAVSHGVAEDLAVTLRVPRDRLSVVFNPVDVLELRRKAEDQPEHSWFSGSQVPIIVGVGRLHPQKDFSTLLRAFARVRKRRQVRLMILGEGPSRARLEAEVVALGLSDDVALPGFVDNPFPSIKRASLLVSSSAWEGLSNVVIHALALGTPIVATDCPSGSREILEGGRLGRLVPPGDSVALASAIDETLSSPAAPVDAADSLQRFSLYDVTHRYLDVLFPPAAGAVR